MPFDEECGLRGRKFIPLGNRQKLMTGLWWSVDIKNFSNIFLCDLLSVRELYNFFVTLNFKSCSTTLGIWDEENFLFQKS